MADNTTLDAGSGGDTIATDDIAGVKYQRVKISTGVDGSATDVDVGGGVEAAALRVTVASDSTGVLSVDDNGSTLSVDDGGGALTVDGTVAATQSGTWTVQPGNTANTTAWKVDASSVAVPITDNSGSITVDNQTISVVGGGVEATAQRVTIASDSTGVLSVDDNGGSLTVDGTVAVSGTVAVTDNSGSLTVDNGGTFAVQDSQVVADNAGFTDGTTKVFMGGYIYDEVAGTALTENDAAAGRINVNRAQVNAIEDGATRGRYATVTAANAVKVDGSAVTQPVSGTVTANAGSGTMAVSNAGTFSVQDSQVLADNAGFTDGTTKVQPVGFIFDEVAGTALTENDVAAARIDSKRASVSVLEDATTRGQRAAVSAAGALKVDGSAATQPVSGTITASNTAGDVAHDGADSGNPVKVGARARTADITSVADADRTNLASDVQGHILTRPYALHENLVSGATAAITDTTSTSVIPSAGASTRNYVTSLLVTNSHATVGTLVTIKDGSGGATLYAGYAAPVGGGFSVSLPTPLRGSAATAVHAVCGTTGSNVYVSASGYKSAL